jgi:hypothetical protein
LQCWHFRRAEHFIGKLKSTKEGNGTLLDHTCLVFVHEPGVIAEAVSRLAQAWQAYAPMAIPAGREVGVIV